MPSTTWATGFDAVKLGRGNPYLYRRKRLRQSRQRVSNILNAEASQHCLPILGIASCDSKCHRTESRGAGVLLVTVGRALVQSGLEYPAYLPQAPSCRFGVFDATRNVSFDVSSGLVVVKRFSHTKVHGLRLPHCEVRRWPLADDSALVSLPEVKLAMQRRSCSLSGMRPLSEGASSDRSTRLLPSSRFLSCRFLTRIRLGSVSSDTRLMLNGTVGSMTAPSGYTQIGWIVIILACRCELAFRDSLKPSTLRNCFGAALDLAALALLNLQEQPSFCA